MWKLGLAVWMAGGLLGQVAGPTASVDWSGLVTSIVGTSPVAGVLLWRLWKADKDVSKAHAEQVKLYEEKESLHAEHVKLVREMAPLLADAVRALPEAQRGMRATMRDAQVSGDVLQDLAALLESIRQERGDRS